MNNENLYGLQQNAISLLQELIGSPSFSKEEDKTAAIIASFLTNQGIETNRAGNNVFAVNKYSDPSKPAILLNSHHDTVKPNPQYTRDPFNAVTEDGKLYGLGSNDAGGSLVSLISVFVHFFEQRDLKYNLVLAATAEEEISGYNGIEALLKNESFKELFKEGQPDFGIVGEPTKMQMAVAEKGLMVLDCISEGRAGHAARDEGDNAIYKAMKDIEWVSTYKFSKISDLLGPVKMSVTAINTENKAHNVVPSACNFIVDVRVNELYSLEEILETIKENLESSVHPRSLRMRSSSIKTDHPLIRAGLSLGRECYGSPTTSDKALMPFSTLKMGPGDSARSHTADEYIFVDEIKEGIEIYIQLLNQLL